MDENIQELKKENEELNFKYLSWRTIAIAYMVLCEKKGIHGEILPMLSKGHIELIRAELAPLMNALAELGK